MIKYVIRYYIVACENQISALHYYKCVRWGVYKYHEYQTAIESALGGGGVICATVFRIQFAVNKKYYANTNTTYFIF